MTEIKTFKIDQTFNDIDNLYDFIMEDVDFIGKYCGIRIENPLKEIPFCITCVEEKIKKTNSVLLYKGNFTRKHRGVDHFSRIIHGGHCCIFSFKNQRNFIRTDELAT